MGALSHLAGDRCDWQIIAVTRTSLAFIFSLIIATASGVRLVLFKFAVLWMRSLMGSVSSLGSSTLKRGGIPSSPLLLGERALLRPARLHSLCRPQQPINHFFLRQTLRHPLTFWLRADKPLIQFLL